MAPPTKRWGDEADDDDDDDDMLIGSSTTGDKSNDGTNGLTIPPPHTSRIDAKGIKIHTTYKANNQGSNLLKTTTKIRVHTVKSREHKSVTARRQWKKFGQAAQDELDENTNVTIQSKEDIYLDDPNADTDLQDEDTAKALTGNINEFWAKQQRRQLERKYDVEDVHPDAAGGDAPAADGWQKVGEKSAAGPVTNKYVPPSQRAGAVGGKGAGTGSLEAMASRLEANPDASAQRSEQNTIRVTNISEATTEADLQDLFGKFGRISRVYVAKDKETKQSRGFAFVSFANQSEASKALEKLQGYGYDHLILKLEWARPSAPKDGGGATQFRSGYGQALAQDTKEKVNFASNLTR